MVRGARGERGGRGGNRGWRGAGLSRAVSAASILSENVGAESPADVAFGYTSDGAAEFAGSGHREAPMRGRGQGYRVARRRTDHIGGRPDVVPIARTNTEHQMAQETHVNASPGRFTTTDRAPLAFQSGPSPPDPNDQIAAGAGAGHAARGGVAGRARGGGVQARGARAWGGATPRRNWYAQPMVFSPDADDTGAGAAVAKVQPITPDKGFRNAGHGGAARRGDSHAGAVPSRRYAAQHVEEADEPAVSGTPASPEGVNREPNITSPPSAKPITHHRANATRTSSRVRQDLASPTAVAARGDGTQKEGGNAADSDTTPGVKRSAARRGHNADDTHALGEQGVAEDHAVDSESAAATPDDSATVTTEEAVAGAKGHNEEGQEHSFSAHHCSWFSAHSQFNSMADSHAPDVFGPMANSTEPDNTTNNTVEEPAHDLADASEQANVVPDLLGPIASDANASARFPLHFSEGNGGPVAGPAGTRSYVQHDRPKGRHGPSFKLTASSYRRQRAADEHQDVDASERVAKKNKRDQAEGEENHRVLSVHPPFGNVCVENFFRFLMVLVVTAAVVFIFVSTGDAERRRSLFNATNSSGRADPTTLENTFAVFP